jgi:glutamate racemase
MGTTQPIGVFDSGYGGLTVLRELVKTLPAFDFIYLGDNARAPYGTRSFQTVYQYTLEAVRWLFRQECPLVLLACNTASAKALRTIQQRDLPGIGAGKRVLGVIRPCTETIGNYSNSGIIGILATPGTVQSGSYPIEIKKFFPEVNVYQQASPMWVPLVENNEQDSQGADYFVQEYLDLLFVQDPGIDVLLLACTHYPLLKHKILQYLPSQVQLISQGPIVAESLRDYLARHPEIKELCSKDSRRLFYTTDSTADFDRQATTFYGAPVESKHVVL